MCYNGHKQSKGETLVIPFPEYPRPALRRDSFLNLNGLWSYAITADEALPHAWDGEILVPYSPETAASGVRRTLQPNQWLHYQRMFTPPDGVGGHVLLHFGAVDNDCVILVNHREVGRHSGGYWPFSLDITDYLQDGENTLHVAVQDASDCGIQARGKQKLTPGGMFYPAQSGIWQTVWLERVPDCYVQELTITPDVPTHTVRFAVSVSSDCLVTFRVTADGREVALARNTAVHHQASVTLKLPEDALHCWSPDDPFLYDVEISLPEDKVESYFAMRQWTCQPDANGIPRFCLNGQPILLNGLLDQGYWVEGLYTPPSDEAVVNELQRVKALGFNLLRKHAKIEPQRWYYHCDRMGLIVWQDFVSGGTPMKSWYVTYLANALLPVLRHFPDVGLFRHLLSRPNEASRTLFLREMSDTVNTLYHHPCIALWVPFNEGWGQFNARQVTEILRRMDATRLIDQASGWFDQGGGDVYSMHNYFYPLKVRKHRRVTALTEYGGIAYPMPGHCTHEKSYGYGTAESREDLTARYRQLQLETVLPQLQKGCPRWCTRRSATWRRKSTAFSPTTARRSSRTKPPFEKSTPHWRRSLPTAPAKTINAKIAVPD